MNARGFVSPLGKKAARLVRPEFLALVPAMALAWFWFGPRGATLVAVAGFPLAYLAQRRQLDPDTAAAGEAVHPVLPRERVVAALDWGLEFLESNGKTTACLVIGLDEPKALIDAYGHTAFEKTMGRVGDRIAGVLRENDSYCRIDETRYGVALAPAWRMDLETAIQVAGRIKAALAEPFSIEAATVYVSASIGFCLASRAPERSGKGVFAAAELAFQDALHNGPGAIRAYSANIGLAATQRDALADQIEAALESGEVVAYFQPQISTDTGDVVGFEALARWQHPTRGILPPMEFLPAIMDAGLAERLGEVILGEALSALQGWDRAGLRVPTVSVNFSNAELRNPNLVAKIKWELDRFDLSPERLVVEILETVIAETDQDVTVHNISALAKLGCGIDLDDFGTGHASLAAIRRFSVQRIKIDRCYVTGVDSDPQQQRMVAAILSMAERLGLKTLAEGVETIGEHSYLAQLGCSHVQGFAIARPMPRSATEEWMRKHRAKLEKTPGLARKTG